MLGTSFKMQTSENKSLWFIKCLEAEDGSDNCPVRTEYVQYIMGLRSQIASTKVCTILNIACLVYGVLQVIY